MALISPTAGPYLGDYFPPGISPGIVLGIMRYGYVLEWQIYGHEVNRTTSWARTTIEGIHLGADWRLTSQAMEYSSPGSLGGITGSGDFGAFPPGDGEWVVDDASLFPLSGTATIVYSNGQTATFTYTGKTPNFVFDDLVNWTLTGVTLIAGGPGDVNPGAAVTIVTKFGGGVPDAAWPWNFADNIASTLPTPVGPKFAVAAQSVSRRWTDSAGTIVLTAATGTTASGSPATLTAPKAISNRRGRLNFDSRLREVPLDFQLLPVTDSTEPAETTMSDINQGGGPVTFPLPPGTPLLVGSTNGFPENGSVTISSGGLSTTVQYAGTDGVDFLNPSGGSGTFPVGATVTQASGIPSRWWTST